MSLTFRSLFRLLFGCISLHEIGLSPGNADVLVGLDLPRHISCRRGRQRSQGDKGQIILMPRRLACLSGMELRQATARLSFALQLANPLWKWRAKLC